jgi:hypothetical protein
VLQQNLEDLVEGLDVCETAVEKKLMVSKNTESSDASAATAAACHGSGDARSAVAKCERRDRNVHGQVAIFIISRFGSGESK